MTSADHAYDVVVVGAGLAGNAAALSAAQAGATVCLLEKGSTLGGSSMRAGGGFMFAGTDLQAAHGMSDDLESLRRDLISGSGGVADIATVDAFVAHQLDTYRWMVREGVKFGLLPTGVPGQLSRIHDTSPGAATRTIHERALAHPAVSFHTHAAASELDSSAHGRVTGVSVAVDGVEQTVHARRGVVLASGGFTQSPELLQIFAPRLMDSMKMGGGENTGDGLRMAWALGAGLRDMGYVQASFGASIPGYPGLTADPRMLPRLLYPNAQGALVVNVEGRRFASEDTNYKALSAILTEQPRGIAFQVFDQKIMDRSSALPGPWHFKGAYADGLVFRANTVEGLASLLGIDAQVLHATVDRYNAFADNGYDEEFGRAFEDYGLTGGGRIDSPPYYGYPCTSGLTTTYCGLAVDSTLNVLNVFGRPIVGLFAAGEILGGLHGAGYLSGSALSKAAVFGRVAGSSAATGQVALRSPDVRSPTR